MRTIVPMFYFPLKILFVDDDKELLESYNYLDLPNKISIQSDPKLALEDVISNPNSNVKIFNDITDSTDASSLLSVDEAVFKFTFDTIKKIISDNDKYNRYGVIVADYEMPILNGIELCNQLNHLPDLIKILLTGKYKPLDAVTALSNNIIDYYLPKGKDSKSFEIANVIKTLQLKYFIKMTQNMFNIIDNKFNFLCENNFAELINNLINSNSITEYYLLNNTGCFLLKNPQNLFILNIYSDSDLDLFCNMYEHLENHILDKIKSRTIIPNYKLPKKVDLSKDFYPCIKYSQYYYNFSQINNFPI